MKYTVDYTSGFKKQHKKMLKQGKDLSKLYNVIEKIANGEELDAKYQNHRLNDNKMYRDCEECHITPDWLLIYKVHDSNLILLLFATGSHSDLFK